MLIPKLEDTINETLSKLSDFRIRFETQKSGSGKDTVLEGLFISVINSEGDELNIENMSGGESVKISSAIFEGLASISNCSFRIMDETVVGLDEETIQSFAEVMLQLQKNVSQLICISHLTEINDLFEEKLEVIKTNGNSKIL
jgi:DNA repair exonuclease SbcCD ATPase subunit